MLTFGAINLAASIAIIVILAEESDDCGLSLRTYLLVFDIALGVLGLTTVLIECFGHKCIKSTVGVAFYYTFLAISIGCVFVMQGVGLYIIGGDENCGNDFSLGYQALLYISAFYFILGGLATGVLIFFMLNNTIVARKGYQSLET